MGGIRGGGRPSPLDLYPCASPPRTISCDLRRYRSSAKHCRQPLPKVCVQHFLYENSTQLCSYLYTRKEFDQNAVL